MNFHHTSWHIQASKGLVDELSPWWRWWHDLCLGLVHERGPPTDHSPNYALALTQLRLVSQVSFGGATSGKWLAPPPSAGQEPQFLPALPIIQTYPDRSAAASPSKCKMPRFGRGRSCNVMMLGYAWAGSVLANLPVEESSYWRSKCQTWQLNFTAHCATKIGGRT